MQRSSRDTFNAAKIPVYFCLVQWRWVCTHVRGLKCVGVGEKQFFDGIYFSSSPAGCTDRGEEFIFVMFFDCPKWTPLGNHKTNISTPTSPPSVVKNIFDDSVDPSYYSSTNIHHSRSEPLISQHQRNLHQTLTIPPHLAHTLTLNSSKKEEPPVLEDVLSSYRQDDELDSPSSMNSTKSSVTSGRSKSSTTSYGSTYNSQRWVVFSCQFVQSESSRHFFNLKKVISIGWLNHNYRGSSQFATNNRRKYWQKNDHGRRFQINNII